MQLRAGERADERQARRERAARVEVGRERDRRTGVDERPARGHRPVEEERARREQHADDVARGQFADPVPPVASRWSTDRAPSSTASGIAPLSVNWSPCSRKRETRLTTRLEVAPRLRGVERAALEEDVGGVGDGRRLRQHLGEREVEVGVGVACSGGTACAPSQVGEPPAARTARSDASSVSRSRP